MRLQKYLYILTIFFISSCHFKSSNDYLQEANDAANGGNFQEAIKLIDKAIAKNPKFKEAYLNRGVYNESLNRIDSAIRDYNKLLKFDPGNISAIYYIGLCKYNQNKFGEAIEYFNKALVTKGFNLNDTGKIQAIVDISKNSITNNVGDTKFDISGDEIIYQRGVSYFKLGKIDEAYSDFMNCIAHNYYVGANHYMVGLCYLQTKQNEKACAEFKQAEMYGDTTSRAMVLKLCK